MSMKVEPSKGSDAKSQTTAFAIQYAGGQQSGWIVPDSEQHAIQYESDLADGPYDAAVATTSASSLDVTIGTVEFYLAGAWAALDATTTVTLEANTTTKVQLGWDRQTADKVIIAPENSAEWSTDDPRMDLYTFTTDTNGVTATTDHRSIGYSSQFTGAGTIEEGTLLESVGFVGASEEFAGTLASAVGEIYRAAGNASDHVVTVEAGVSRVAWSHNAEYKSSDWRFIVADEPAAMISFENDGDIKFLTSQGNGEAGEAITWQALTFKENGDMRDHAGNLIYDYSTQSFPQERLGGPASQLTAYPIPASDIADGPGSGLSADLIDDEEPGSLVGQWKLIDTFEDSNSSTKLDFDHDLSTTYDIYKLVVVGQNHNSVDNDLEVRVNNIGSSKYDNLVVDASSDVIRKVNQTAWTDIANAGPFRSTHAEILIRGNVSTPTTYNYPTISIHGGQSVSHDLPHTIAGELRVDIESINSIQLFSQLSNFTGKIRLMGMDIV